MSDSGNMEVRIAGSVEVWCKYVFNIEYEWMCLAVGISGCVQQEEWLQHVASG